VNVGGAVVQIAAGTSHTCAVLDTGAVRCWGMGRLLGYGYDIDQIIGDDEAPAKAGDVDVGGLVAAISAGGNHTCAVLTDGRLRCWGESQNGELGYGNIDPVGVTAAPSTAGDVQVGGPVKQVSAGLYTQGGGPHTCALLENGHVRCWGMGMNGQLGYGNTNDIGDDETPASAGDVDVGGVVTQVMASGAKTCALLVGGHVRCWGIGYLGYGKGVHFGAENTPASGGDVPVN
jgi:alpha-tubulin suppressor-like RCC1 family protein